LRYIQELNSILIMKGVPKTWLMIGRPRRAMAALAPAYCIGLTAALPLGDGWMAVLIVTVPFATMSAIPLLLRGSRAFNNACWCLASLATIVGCVFGGVLFLPAVVPLLFATSPSLSAPVPQLSVAAVLAALAVGISFIP
jgi:hypothetical protein